MIDKKKILSDRRIYIIVAVIYLIIAFARFSNIFLNITHTVPGADGDTYQNLWDIWWVNYALFKLHASIFYTNLLFWPVGSNLSFQTMSPIGSLLSYPFQIVNVPFAYNTLFFLGFAISGLCMFILADYLIKNRYAAFIAGLFFSFSAFHIAEAYAHLDWIFIGWVPLAIYFFIRMANDDYNSLKLSFGLGASFVLTVFMGDVEQGIMLLIALFFIFLFYLIGRETMAKLNRKFFKAILISAIIGLILGSWGFVTLVSAALKPGNLSIINSYNTLKADAAQSYSIFSFLLPSFYSSYMPSSLFTQYYYHIFSVSPIERTGYITYIVLILCIIGVYKNLSKTKLWLALALIFGLLALGPFIQTTSITSIPGPFIILHAIPLLNVIQEPGRFGILIFTAISIMAAYGTEKVLNAAKKVSKTMPYTAIVVISLIFLAETFGSPITNGAYILPTTSNATIPNFYYSIQKLNGNFSVVQLPATSSAYVLPQLYPGQASYYTTASRKPILGGYITRATLVNNEYLDDIPLVVETSNLENYGVSYYASPVNENYTRQTLFGLYIYQTLFVVLNKNAYNGSVDTYLYYQLVSTFGHPVYSDDSLTAFSAAAAENSTAFRYFVELPAIGDWVPARLSYLGGSINVWSPSGNGAVAIYAPYPNSTNITKDIKYDAKYTTNATLKFDALDLNGTGHLTLFKQVGEQNPVQIAYLTVPPTLTTYKIRVSNLVAGVIGNSLFFAVSKNDTSSKNGSTPSIFISNITITGSSP